jgi:hypothetical protein
MVMAIALLQGATGMGVVSGIGSVMITAAPYVGLGCIVAAGVALRSEGGINFGMSGGFAKWMVWAFIFVAIPTVPLIINSLTNNSVGGLTASFSGGTSEFTSLGVGAQNFFHTWLVGKVVPSIAGYLVVKAILDSNDGESPMPSLVSAIFVLSVSGIWSMAKSWVGSDQYGIATGMSGALSYLLATLCPIGAIFCFIAAVVQSVKGDRWGRLVISGIAMLSATGIWTLVKSWG